MRYKLLGKSGLRVSELNLGTMTFGKCTDETEAARVLADWDLRYDTGSRGAANCR